MPSREVNPSRLAVQGEVDLGEFHLEAELTDALAAPTLGAELVADFAVVVRPVGLIGDPQQLAGARFLTGLEDRHRDFLHASVRRSETHVHDHAIAPREQFSARRTECQVGLFIKANAHERVLYVRRFAHEGAS